MKSTILATALTVALTMSTAHAQQKVQMSSSYPSSLPIIGTASMGFVERINLISDKVMFEYHEPNKLIPPLEALDGVSDGSVDSAFTLTGWWQGKIKAASLFASVPFGPEPGEMLAWIFYDDGLKFWQQMYDDNGYDVHIIPCGIYGPETSGWFKKEINSIEDLKGLNMRFFGLGAEVMQKLGVSTSLLATGDVFPALERGAIDATEFSMPLVDARLGFHKIAKYNYFPGWHQPSTLFELLVNKELWEGLDETAQAQIRIACEANITANLANSEALNFPAMVENIEKHGVTIKQWSPEMLDAFETAWNEVAAEMAAEDAFFKTVWDDLQEFRKGYATWGNNIYLPRPRK